ncbi:uncharacterized protein LOC135631456 [Musa acuminata AAA Group]|uniref:uncharacterized protein LOC135631456 n=1 Tax=Musa acuminata AAA Group TaxID=214697 RepID=UPI0031DB58B0
MDGGNGIPGGMLPSSMSSGGLMGLDMSIHPQQKQQQMLHHQQQLYAHHMLPFQAPVGSDDDHQAQYANRHAQYVQAFGQAVRGKQQQPAMSSEEEAGYGEDVEEQARRGGVSQPSPSPSPWQRMKWTDNMIRLLIKVVYRVGDDGGAAGEGEQQAHVALAKGKKSAAAAAAAASALLQKKGKWKSVSRAMMENGFCVSPQQCEDKFNDLNKRYKRLNDLLGKGTACRVVENQTLLDTMDNLYPKAKEEARKLLNSKHLFFREMCAYHHAGGASSCAAPPPPQIPPPHPPDQQQQICFHHPPPAAAPPAKLPGDSRGRGTFAEEEGMAEEADDDDDVDSEEDEDDYDEEEEEEDDDMEGHGHKRHCHHHQQQPKNEEGEEDEDSKGFTAGAKRLKRASSQMSASPPHSLTLSSSSSIQQLRSEMMAVSGEGEQQQRQWLRRKATELEEQRVAYQGRAFQLERQRFKWLRFSSNKEREMERMKLDNERLRLENDRMLLLLRQKELELVHGGGALSTATVISAEAQQQQHISNADHAVVGN